MVSPRPCFYCERPMLPRSAWDGIGPQPLDLETTDHIFPAVAVRLMRGIFADDWLQLNKVRCCAGCNNLKANAAPVAWLSQIPPAGAARLIERLIALGVDRRSMPHRHQLLSPNFGEK